MCAFYYCVLGELFDIHPDNVFLYVRMSVFYREADYGPTAKTSNTFAKVIF